MLIPSGYAVINSNEITAITESHTNKRQLPGSKFNGPYIIVSLRNQRAKIFARGTLEELKDRLRTRKPSDPW